MYKSPAKINLVLKVFGKRADGYHKMASLMQTISLFDELEIELCQQDTFSCSHPFLKMDQDNLCIKALTLFREVTQIKQPIRIHLKKNIPLGAGLGGGSSNAATVLYALDHLFNTRLKLEHIAAKLGSDVPFFFSQGFALVYDRGEKFIPLIQNKHMQLHLSFPTVQSLTQEVYQQFQTSQNTYTEFDLLQFYFEDRLKFFNDLEQPALNLQNELVKHRKYLLSCGFSHVQMTGSGSTFMIFDDVTPSKKQLCHLTQVEFIKRKFLNWY